MGFLCAAAAVFFRYHSQKNRAYRGHAEAKVVDILTEPRTGASSLSEFRNRQAAVFEFYAGGRLVKVKDTKDTYPCPYFLNQRVLIDYDTETPENFCIASRSIRKWIPDGFSFLSVCLIVAGCVTFCMYAAGIRL
jgi:hypothetical protein